MNLTFYIDVVNEVPVTSLTDSTLPTLDPIMQNDNLNIALQAVVPVPSNVSSTALFQTTTLPFSLIKMGIGLIDAKPTTGTYCVSISSQSGQITAPLAFNATKYQLQTALNALSYVTAQGGITVQGANVNPALEVGVSNLHLITWNNPAVVDTLDFSSLKLTPKCLTKVKSYVDDALGTVWLLKFYQAPLAFSQNFAYPVPDAPVVVSTRTGTGTANAVQSYTYPTNSLSSVSLLFGALPTQIFPVASSTAVIQAALNAIYTDGVQRFSVTQQSRNVYLIEFIGPLGLAAQSTLSVSMALNAALNTPVGTLDLTSLLLEAAIDTAPSIPLTLEIEITNGSEVTTPVQLPVTILNDMIDGISVYNEPNWIQSITDPIAAIEYDGTANFFGTQAYVTLIGDTIHSQYTINHNLATLNIIPTIRENGGSNDVIPGDEWECTIIDANNVLITFSTPPATNQFVVMLITVLQSDHWIPHQHSTDDIFYPAISGGTSLTQILENLTAFTDPLSGWPAIPVNKVPQLPWSILNQGGAAGTDSGSVIPYSKLPGNVVLTDSGGYIPISDIPLSVPRVDTNGNLIVTDQNGNQQTIMNVSTSTFSQTVADNLTNQIAGSSVIYQAILQALENGGSLPSGTTVLAVPDFTVTVPTIQQEKGPSNKVSVTTNVSTSDVNTQITGSAVTTTTNGAATTTADQSTTIPVYDYLSPCIVTSTNGGSISAIPASPTAGAYYTLSQQLSVRTSGPRRGRFFKSGSILTFANNHWYAVRIDGVKLYPLEPEQVILRVIATDKMFFAGSEFGLDFVLQAMLQGNVLGRGDVVLEGAPMTPDQEGSGKNLGSLTWTVLQTFPVLLDSGNVFHSVSMTLQRAANNALTGTTSSYGQSSAIDSGVVSTVFSLYQFAIRCRFINFDYEDVTDAARGALTLTVKGARSSIVPL